MKIMMLKGLPGSGKSTWAKQFVMDNPGWVRINKDSLREMMSSYRPGKDEELILGWRDALIMSALRRGKSVIVDDTNFHPKHEERLKNMIYGEQGLEDPLFICDFEIKMFDTPLAECIKNDLKRPVSVGEKVIKKMWREFLAPKFAKPVYDLTLKPILICDLDGTLAIHNGRNPYDMVKCETDGYSREILDIITSMNYGVIFVTGREEKWREKTVWWLTNQVVFPFDYQLFMRPTDDHREDSIIKQEIYDREIKGKYNVEFVLDDRNRVVDMWRRNGLTCLQVAEGDF